jgi:hypothetical protein
VTSVVPARGVDIDLRALLDVWSCMQKSWPLATGSGGLHHSDMHVLFLKDSLALWLALKVGARMRLNRILFGICPDLQ